MMYLCGEGYYLKCSGGYTHTHTLSLTHTHTHTQTHTYAHVFTYVHTYIHTHVCYDVTVTDYRRITNSVAS